MARTARSEPAPPDQPRTPVRTCVGCRSRDEQSALLRVVAEPDGRTTHGWAVVPDGRGRRPGRGAYVHPVAECLEQAVARRAFGRALRLPAGAQVDPSPVREQVQGER